MIKNRYTWRLKKLIHLIESKKYYSKHIDFIKDDSDDEMILPRLGNGAIHRYKIHFKNGAVFSVVAFSGFLCVRGDSLLEIGFMCESGTRVKGVHQYLKIRHVLFIIRMIIKERIEVKNV